jgi:L-amino acid N-acyltransferase YncA
VYTHRLAKKTDLPEIVDIYNSTIPSRQVTADLEAVSVESRETWFDEHTPETRPLWVVEIDKRIAGWLSFSSFYGRPAYRQTAEISVYIHSAFRKSGVASYLLSAALEQSLEFGVKVLLGFIFGHNQPSLKFFQKFGFEHWGLLPNVAVIDGVEHDLVIVGRRIAP